LVFEEGKGKDKDGKKRGKNKGIEKRGKNKGIEKRGKKNGETKIILNACCLTLSYFFKF